MFALLLMHIVQDMKDRRIYLFSWRPTVVVCRRKKSYKLFFLGHSVNLVHTNTAVTLKTNKETQGAMTMRCWFFCLGSIKYQVTKVYFMKTSKA